MATQQRNGKCFLCGKPFSKQAMTGHLKKCRQSVPSAGRSKMRRAFHIVVEGAERPSYWLHLEAAADARLSDLDSLLKGIWLECCGHLSAFHIGGENYSVAPLEELDEQGMTLRLADVLAPGMKFSYEYDFGSTTPLILRVASEREAAMPARKIVVQARNYPPDLQCVGCDRPAQYVCSQCMWDEEAWFCKRCLGKHPCGEDMALPIVNSPRMGECAYTGPEGAWKKLEVK